MKITLGVNGLEKSWQAAFPETTKCHKCKGEARIAFVAHEAIDKDDRLSKQDKLPRACVCHLHKNGGKGDYWLHDCCCVAVYFCKECFQAVALWNQA